MKANVFNRHQYRYENLAIYPSSESITQISHYNTLWDMFTLDTWNICLQIYIDNRNKNNRNALKKYPTFFKKYKLYC